MRLGNGSSFGIWNWVWNWPWSDAYPAPPVFRPDFLRPTGAPGLGLCRQMLAKGGIGQESLPLGAPRSFRRERLQLGNRRTAELLSRY